MDRQYDLVVIGTGVTSAVELLDADFGPRLLRLLRRGIDEGALEAHE